MDGQHKPTKQAISGPNAFRALGLIFCSLFKPASNHHIQKVDTINYPGKYSIPSATHNSQAVSS